MFREEFREAPSSTKIVRAVNGPGCQIVSPTQDQNVVELTWQMDCDYRVNRIVLIPV